jgi:hypothetical protein
MSGPLSILDYRQPVEFSMGEVITRTWSVLSRHFLTFLVLIGIADLIPVLITLSRTSAGPQFGSPRTTILAAGLIAAFLQFILNAFGQAIVVFAAFQDLRGRPVSAVESLQQGVARLFPVIIASILVALTEVVGFMLCVAPGLIAMAALAVVLPSCVVERKGPFASMSRSADLTSGHWWPIIGVGAAWMCVGLVVSAVIQAALPGVAGMPRLLATWGWQVISGSFGAVYAAILYHDLRAVREGIGIDEIASVFD